MNKILLTISIVLMVFFMVTGVQAKGIQKMAVGLGAAAAPDFEGSEDYEGVPLLFVDARWASNRSVSIIGNKGRINLIPHPYFRAGLAMEYIKERDDVDNERVKLLEDVDASFMLGAFLGFDYERWNGSVEYLSDVSDGNDGAILRLNGGYKIPVNQEINANIGLFATWADDDYMESYFTVSSAGSAASGLNTFDAGSGIKDVGLMMSVHYTPWQNWGIMGLFIYKKLLDDAQDSPIVDKEGDDGQAVIGVMLTYRF